MYHFCDNKAVRNSEMFLPCHQGKILSSKLKHPSQVHKLQNHSCANIWISGIRYHWQFNFNIGCSAIVFDNTKN